MRYTRLGNTGLTVSRICLGCMSYGSSKWRPWVLDEDAARPFFRRAVEHGINFFDTADMYSLGVSEEVTGRALREYARLDEIVLASKVFFPMGDGPNMGGLSRKHVLQACEASLRRLGVETIDLYQIHRFDPDTPIEETLEALDLLVRQGKVRYIGASSGFAWQLAQALGASERRGWARFVSMQNHYNLLYREEEREMIPLCAAAGLGVIPWSPLARGLLAQAQTAPTQDTVRAGSDAFTGQLYDNAGDGVVLEALRGGIAGPWRHSRRSGARVAARQPGGDRPHRRGHQAGAPRRRGACGGNRPDGRRAGGARGPVPAAAGAGDRVPPGAVKVTTPRSRRPA